MDPLLVPRPARPQLPLQKGEREAEVDAEAGGEVGGIPLTITPPPDEHRLNVEEREIGRKEIQPKVRAQMQRGTPLPFLGRG